MSDAPGAYTDEDRARLAVIEAEFDQIKDEEARRPDISKPVKTSVRPSRP